MSESKKGFPQKKKASDFIIYAVIAIVLAAVGVWGGYVLQETANMKGEVNFQKALDRSGDYMNLNSFLFAIISNECKSLLFGKVFDNTAIFFLK